MTILLVIVIKLHVMQYREDDVAISATNDVDAGVEKEGGRITTTIIVFEYRNVLFDIAGIKA